MTDIVVGSTIPTFKALSNEGDQWLSHAKWMVTYARDYAGIENVHFFAAIEHDGRGLAPFTKLLDRLMEVSEIPGATATYWTFSLCDHSEAINGSNRLFRICTGRNMIGEFALRNRDVEWLLYLDSDIVAPPESISSLIEMDYPIVGGDVPSYCLGGRVMGEEYPTYPVHEHWNTAGFLMVNREIFSRVQWRSENNPGQRGLTDDPTFAADVRDIFGYETRVRKDLQGMHKPLVSLENRGHDLTLYEQVGKSV